MKTLKEKKVSPPFSLTDFTKGRVKRLTLHIEDVKAKTNDESVDKVTVALISGTLYIYKNKQIELKPGEDNFYTVNFMYPLEGNKEFKRHILSIIKSALEQDKQRVSK
jgi:hypothetical protein